MLCRLNCLQSGGYIEVLDPERSLIVNNVAKKRSRLVDGDTLTLGNITLEVTIPQTSSPSSPDFHINFEEEGSDSTLSDDVIEFDSDLESYDVEAITATDPPLFSEEETETEDIFEDKGENSDVTPATGLGDARFSFENSDHEEGEFHPAASDNAPPGGPSHNKDQPPSANDDRSAAATPEPNAPPPSGQRSSQPQFSFDSTDPADVDLSETELQDVLEDAVEESFPTMNISISDASSSDSDSISVSLDHDVDLSLLDSPFDDQANIDRAPDLADAVHTGKFYRWSGAPLENAVAQILERMTRINLFQCKGLQTTALPLNILRDNQFLNQDTQLYLLTRLSMPELQNQIRENRWDDRMGHPRALRMFLEYAPTKTLEHFFQYVDAVLTVEDNEASLIRLTCHLP